ncbi:MAG TPA: pinensin family lanthipeptide [Longimicrobium sp.]|nr:pinensin family lanthipeptide [Longimicrobium sp.]
MQKLRMTLEELEVTSFETERKDEEGGTVAAHGFSGYTCPRCPSVPTWYGTCCTP